MRTTWGNNLLGMNPSGIYRARTQELAIHTTAHER